MAVECERAAYEAQTSAEANEALVRKAACYKQCGRFSEAASTLARVAMFALDGEMRREVMYERELAHYLAGECEAALSVMEEREALDIENLGGTVAEALVNRGLIATPLDLFRLSLDELGALNLGTDEEPRRFGEKNAAKALAALEKAKTMPLERWLTAFGIPTIGTVTARAAATYHRSLAELATSDYLALLAALEQDIDRYNALNPAAKANKGADKEALTAEREALRAQFTATAEPYIARGYLSIAADGPNKLKLTNPLGSVSTRHLRRYFASAAGQGVLATLADLGIAPLSAGFTENLNERAAGPLSGKTFVLTGALSRPRPEFEKMIAAAGGKATGSVTKNTDYLVAGEGGGSKREKAAKLNIPIIDEAALLAMINA